ncbi:MAG: hypothetical protein HFJ54_00080 [Clostridia bacterium]|nr:hypothetical protein [Clostridia bacterium]
MNLLGFTPQEYKVIEELMKVSKEVNVIICLDSLKKDNINNETDIFYSNKIAAQKLIEIANNNNIEIEDEVYLNKNYRFKNEELIHLEQNIYENIYNKYNKENENILLFLAANPYSEIEHVANEIAYEVRENSYRYKEIGIITKNIDTYSGLIKAIFEKYDIPVYIDEKKDLSENILIKYIISLLEIFAKNWSYESVISYIKTSFCDIEEKDIYEIENFAKKWGVKYSKWYKNDWDFGEENKQKLEYLNLIRRKIVSPLLEFKEMTYKKVNAKDLSKAIYEFLIKNNIDKKLKDKATNIENVNKELSDEYQASFNTVIKILDEIVKIFGEEKITFDKYSEILKISFMENGLGKIPAGIDEVTVGDTDRSRSHKVKVIFIIGLNDRKFSECK